MPFKLILRRCEVVFLMSGVKILHFFERLMEINTMALIIITIIILLIIIMIHFYIVLFNQDHSASQYIITLVIRLTFNPALTVHNLHSLGSNPARRHFIGVMVGIKTWAHSVCESPGSDHTNNIPQHLHTRLVIARFQKASTFLILCPSFVQRISQNLLHISYLFKIVQLGMRAPDLMTAKPKP